MSNMSEWFVWLSLWVFVPWIGGHILNWVFFRRGPLLRTALIDRASLLSKRLSLEWAKKVHTRYVIDLKITAEPSHGILFMHNSLLGLVYYGVVIVVMAGLFTGKLVVETIKDVPPQTGHYVFGALSAVLIAWFSGAAVGLASRLAAHRRILTEGEAYRSFLIERLIRLYKAAGFTDEQISNTLTEITDARPTIAQQSR